MMKLSESGMLVWEPEQEQLQAHNYVEMVARELQPYNTIVALAARLDLRSCATKGGLRYWPKVATELLHQFLNINQVLGYVKLDVLAYALAEHAAVRIGKLHELRKLCSKSSAYLDMCAAAGDSPAAIIRSTGTTELREELCKVAREQGFFQQLGRMHGRTRGPMYDVGMRVWDQLRKEQNASAEMEALALGELPVRSEFARPSKSHDPSFFTDARMPCDKLISSEEWKKAYMNAERTEAQQERDRQRQKLYAHALAYGASTQPSKQLVAQRQAEYACLERLINDLGKQITGTNSSTNQHQLKENTMHHNFDYSKPAVQSSPLIYGVIASTISDDALLALIHMREKELEAVTSRITSKSSYITAKAQKLEQEIKDLVAYLDSRHAPAEVMVPSAPSDKAE